MTTNHSRPDTSSFIHAWLSREDPSPAYTTFEHVPLAEVEGSRTVVFKSLAETVFLHHNDPQEFLANLVTLGYPELAGTLDQRPRNPKTRKSNFGEILASEYLRQSEGYRIPVYRLRYNPNPESPMQGDDVLAFRFGEADGTGREVLVAEAKVRSQFASAAVMEACDQLEGAHRPQPKSITFVVQVLRQEDRDEEADQVLTFLNRFGPSQPTKRALLFLVTGNRPHDPFKCVEEREKVIDNLMAANLWVAGLDDFVDQLFDFEVDIDTA